MKKGFTLVELAIVMVIVGLLVGGVLAGQTLIKQAKINKTVREFENLNLGWKAFQLKYNGIPGDLPGPALFFPACDVSMWGDAAQPIDPNGGDGNGRIDLYTEVACIWPQLAVSGVYMPIGLTKDYWGEGYPAIDLNFSAGHGAFETIWPADRSDYGIVTNQNFGFGAKNYFALSAKTGYPYIPEDILSIDNKIDDGKPSSGTILVNDGGGCVAGSDYDVSNTTKVCGLNYKLN